MPVEIGVRVTGMLLSTLIRGYMTTGPQYLLDQVSICTIRPTREP